MSSTYVEVSEVIMGRPEEIYAVLSDYQNGHPNVLPKKNFSDLQVEKGGNGAGTVVRVSTHAWGATQHLHLVVTEPEPGRVLVETDLNTGLFTTFTVIPTSETGQALVKIATQWPAKTGLAGFIESKLTPLVARGMYKKELRQLEAYVNRKN